MVRSAGAATEAKKKVEGLETNCLLAEMAPTQYTHTRTALPRYEVRGGRDGPAPCVNVPHVVATLQQMGAAPLTEAQVYAMVRPGAAATRAAARLPAGLTVHKLSEDERMARPYFRVTRVILPAVGSGGGAGAVV
jgi:hypothetical protein|eukprot:COSAG03_NODE_1307_length_4354_cov_7.345476_3_plen_135_part_00